MLALMPKGDTAMGGSSSARPAPAQESDAAQLSSSEDDPDFELGKAELAGLTLQPQVLLCCTVTLAWVRR